jgi:ABC-type sugar transport system substrate-binding protein
MVKHLKGQPVEKWIDTGVQVATKDNMDTPPIKSLIEPDLSSIK